MSSLLQLLAVSKRFGGLTANEDVSFDVERGQIVGLIGPNGAGKTTLFNCVAGSSAPSDGTIRLNGRLISGLTPEKCARAGVGRTFQIARTFHGMTALENVLTGALLRERRVTQARERARAWLAFVHLERFADKPASTMTISEQRRLAVARSLATDQGIRLAGVVMVSPVIEFTVEIMARHRLCDAGFFAQLRPKVLVKESLDRRIGMPPIMLP